MKSKLQFNFSNFFVVVPMKLWQLCFFGFSFGVIGIGIYILENQTIKGIILITFGIIMYILSILHSRKALNNSIK